MRYLASFADIDKFFAIFAAFGLAFWYGTKLFLDGQLDNVGAIVV